MTRQGGKWIAGDRRRLIVWAGIVAAVVLLVVAVDLGSASPRLCTSCHEMSVRSASWAQSPHAEVACVECHQTPRTALAYPLKLADRAALLAHDVSAHFSVASAEPIDGPVAGSKPIADAVCLQCHDPNRKATSGFRILIDHAEHARRNGSCVSCHVRTAHPVESRGTAMSLMSQCFTCHGTPEKPKASAKCGVCHPAGYKLLPASHEPATWKRTHGSVAEGDRDQCRMCHAQSFCDDCHGLPMPHPEGWDRGATGHSVFAKRDRTVCEQCHGASKDMCTMCHHKAFEPARGTWIKQHYVEVRDKGTAFCLDCHSPVFCVTCHAAAPESR